MKRQKRILAVGFVLAAAGTVALGRVSTSKSEPHPNEVTPERVEQLLRARLGVPDSIKLTVEPLKTSAAPAFLETTVTSDNGKEKKTSPLGISKDGHYLILGSVFHLSTPGSNAEIVKDAREMFKVPDAISLTADAPRPSGVPGFEKVKLSASNGSSQDFFLTRDRRTLILGQLLRLQFDPGVIATANQPSVGPAHAPVTIVEYADMECPSCARMQEFIDNQLLPKYGDKVRIIFKDFPLGPSHPWGTAGAVASECGYEIDSSKFLPYRSTIFRHQADVDAVQTDMSKVRDLLLTYGEEVGLDRARLASCMDSQASLPRVQEGRKEGDELTVYSTPTFFINGKIMVGVIPADDFYRAVDEALKAATEAKAVRAKGSKRKS